MSSPPDAIDRYFTRNIVGDTMVVDLGPSLGVKVKATSPFWVEVMADRAGTAMLAARTLFDREPDEALAGRPVSLTRLRRWQWRWVALGVALWTALLVGAAAALWQWAR